jgi:hypothetical protein
MAANSPCRIEGFVPGQNDQPATPIDFSATAALCGPMGAPSPVAPSGSSGEAAMTRSLASYPASA